MTDEKLLKKQTRIRKQQKKRFAPSTGTLSRQVARTKAAHGYVNKRKTRIKVEI